MKTFLLRLSAIIIIMGYAYLRFFRKRNFSHLYFILDSDCYYMINYRLIFICIFSIIVFGYLTYSLVNKYNNIAYLPNNIITLLLGKLLVIILTSLKALEDWIGESIPNSYDKLKVLGLFLYAFLKNKSFLLVFLPMYLPYFIVVFIFLFEILCFFQLKFFFLFLPLLLIPLIIKLIMYLINDLIFFTLNMIEDKVNITHNFEFDGRDCFVFTKKEHLFLSDSDFFSYHTEYLTLYPLKGFFEDYYKKNDKYNTLIFIFLSCGYLFGWLFVLFINILSFF